MNRRLLIFAAVFLVTACADTPETLETPTCVVTYTGADLKDEAKALAQFYQMPDYDPMGETPRPVSIETAGDRIEAVIAVDADLTDYELYYKLQAAALGANVFGDQPFNVRFMGPDGAELFSASGEEVPLHTSRINNELYYDRGIPQKDLEKLKTLLDNQEMGDEITLYAERTTANYLVNYMVFREAITEEESYADIIQLKAVREEAARLNLSLPALAFLIGRDGRKLNE
jgi:hypothetical protein